MKTCLIVIDAQESFRHRPYFTAHDLPIDLPKIESFRGRGGADRELTIPELVRVGNDSRTPETVRNETRANFHFRLVEVAMMLLLPLLAVALAVPPKRSPSAIGVFRSTALTRSFRTDSTSPASSVLLWLYILFHSSRWRSSMAFTSLALIKPPALT